MGTNYFILCNCWIKKDTVDYAFNYKILMLKRRFDSNSRRIQGLIPVHDEKSS